MHKGISKNIKSVAVEGPEGSGKSTILVEISKYLKTKGLDFIITREPGGVDIAEKIRNIILDTSHTGMDIRTEALLYAAARRQHLVQKVFPAIEAGKLVIFDRFVDSSLAYQGVGRGIGIDSVLSVNEFALDGFMPDITLLLDCPPEVGLERINSNRNREINRLDLESLDFHHRIRNGYHELVKRTPDRFEVINADQSQEDVLKDVLSVLDKYIF